MTAPTPYQGDDQYPAAKQYDLSSVTVSTSPATLTLALPEQGVFLATISVWYGNQTDRATVNAIIKYYRWNGVGGWTLATDTLGPVAFASGGLTTGLTVSAPDTSGVVTLTAASSRGNSEVHAAMKLFRLSSAADQFAV